MKHLIAILWFASIFGSIENAMEKSGIKAMSIAVISGYKIDWAKGYGTGASGREITQKSTFHADDLSLPITAMAALKAMQDGNISLTKDINSVLLYWKVPNTKKTRHRKVTLRTLLEQTSGLAGPTLEEAYMQRVPGRQFNSNPLGYEVIRLALTDRYHESFAQVMNRLLFVPLGMKDSMYDPDCSHFTTTSLDMAKWLISLQKSVSGISERLLTTEVARSMINPRIDEEHAIGFIASRGANGEKVPFGRWFISHGNRSLVFGTAGGDGVVILSDGKGDLKPILDAIVMQQKWE